MMATQQISRSAFSELVARASALADDGPRRMLGITGAPGAGKSTLARELVDAVGERAVLVPMDGFHLADAELKRLGRWERKGAIDTFDGHGYVNALRRIHAADEEVVYLPDFRRDLEEPIAGAIAVTAGVSLVVTEGNYLLAREQPWSAIVTVLDEVWYVDPPEDTRQERLIARHMTFGRPEAEAVGRSLGTDQVNADRIAETRHLADLLVVG